MSAYQVGVLDETVQVQGGVDETMAATETGAKLSLAGEGIHILYTDQGTYRVEAPINKGMTILGAMATCAYCVAPTVHNHWFLDNVQRGTKVLFAAECGKPSRKHPYGTVRCTFWFPDPDSTTHEYKTLGDFSPVMPGDGSNVEKTANSLCGTGKLSAATEAQICGQK